MAATVNYFIELTPSAEAMAEKLRGLASYKIPLAMKAGIDTAMPDVIENIKATRLSGKGPFPPPEHRLGVVTGLLRSSVSPIASTMEVGEDSATVTGGLQVISVPYANIHEFGFSGEESVRAHTRRIIKFQRTSPRTGKLLKRPRRTTTMSTVRAYTRQMNMPERRPFRTGMEENLIRISDAINRQLGAALENV